MGGREHVSSIRLPAANGTDYAVIEGEGDMKKTLALAARRRVRPGARGPRARAAGAIQAGGSRSLAVKEGRQKAEKEDDEKETRPKKAGSQGRAPGGRGGRVQEGVPGRGHQRQSAQETEDGKTVDEIESVDRGPEPRSSSYAADGTVLECEATDRGGRRPGAGHGRPRRRRDTAGRRSTKAGEDHSRARSIQVQTWR